MAGSRSREAFEVAADALRLEIASPAIRAAFLIEITEAAVAVGDMAAAVQSYQEARGWSSALVPRDCNTWSHRS